MNEQLLNKWKEELDKLNKKKTLSKIDKVRKSELETKIQNSGEQNQSSGVFVQKQVIGFEVDKIVPNPKQPRKLFDDKSISELAESIKRYGQLEPVVVADIAGKHYLVSGERRLRAIKHLGLKRIDGVINDAIRTQDDLFLFAIAENADRKNLNCGELALVIKSLRDENNFSFDKIAQLVNLSKTAVYRHHKISSLPSPLLDKVIYSDINQPNTLEKVADLTSYEKQEYFIDLLSHTDVPMSYIKDDASQVIKEKVSQNERSFSSLSEGVTYFKDKLELIEKSAHELTKRDFNKLINDVVDELKLLKKMR